MTTSPPEARTIETRGLKRIVVRAVAVAAVVLIGWGAQTEILLVTSEHNGEFPASSYALREDDFHHPRLRLLRSREKLDDVVSTAKTQFEKVVLLRGWVHRQWKIGAAFYYPPWDAVEILDLARKHDNRGFCAQYAIVFLQACQSMGIHARYVDLPGHFVVAVWSDDFNRWVVMDPTNDLHYERDGAPMRGRDLNRAYWTGDHRELVSVDSDGRRKAVGRDDLSNYRLYSASGEGSSLRATTGPTRRWAGTGWRSPPSSWRGGAPTQESPFRTERRPGIRTSSASRSIKRSFFWPTND